MKVALHKLHLAEPLRYSEDLDYVRTTASGIGPVTQALSRLGEDLGFEARTRVGEHPKILWRTTATTGAPVRLKVEVNTYERSPALPLVRHTHAVASTWWSGEAEVLTFQPAELVATKIRALYQRSKGRDLFDLWLALTQLGLAPGEILAAFAPYRPLGLTAAASAANLAAKLGDQTFRRDIEPLVREVPSGYDVDKAAAYVADHLLARLDSLPPATAKEGH